MGDSPLSFGDLGDFAKNQHSKKRQFGYVSAPHRKHFK